MIHRTSLARVVLTAALVGASAAPAAAQAYNYPQFQPPRVAAAREFNFGLAGAGDFGTVLLGQWREPLGVRSHFSLDAGLATPNRASVFFFGGQFARDLVRASPTMPLDLLFTIGAGLASLNPDGDGGNLTVVRVPVGLSIGHRFPIQGSPGMSITPYAQPRVAYSHCGDCFDESDLGIDFELGGDFTFTPALALRAAARIGGNDNAFLSDDAFGISLAWTPGRR